ncbi:Peptidoglycan glycosyltransferase [Oceanithermus profundus DSM 14977]|uniref:peptidoglycan glycosyltransferase n=1 Tax=Oceanithermus profundus (strain DSM 14977 / NBRC 100410 / VKM B-2274 / 506) TaxID=670487 RepID=E4U9Y6_OCEP5|nr:transglycosylase domain-containing protein [Oceanithermus profundus]ADR37300.1 Peptidoglycan glycosyltransferase [Oceanithermus profundus DSM 14977]
MKLRRYLLLAFLAVFLGTAVAAAIVVRGWTRDLPSLDALENLRLTSTTTVFARDGTPIAQLASEEGGITITRMLVKLEDVSPAAVAAIVASEDQRFFRHYGIDWIRIAGAFWQTLRGNLQGGSSISVQVIKNTLLRNLSGVRTLERKFKELPLAIQLERLYSKEEILEMYLNVSFWGGNLWGIRAASEAYFGKDPAELTLAEGAYLAALIPGPNARFRDLPRVRRRMKTLLEQMVREGWITQAMADAAWREPVVPNGWKAEYDAEGNLVSAELLDPGANSLPDLEVEVAPHFVYEIRKELIRRFGRAKVFGQGGLRVYTTLDVEMQRAAEEAAQAAVKRGLPEGAQLALVGLDPETGEVYALLGALPGTEGEFNRATQLGDGKGRSPGSAIKPFVYTAALGAGWSQASMVEDKEVSFPDPTQPDGVWKPKNYDGTYLDRAVTIRYAMDRSLNVPAILTADALGVRRLAGELQAAGFQVPKNPGLSIAIGGGIGATPLQMAAAYAAFVNGGWRVEPQLILRVEDQQGHVLYEARPLRQRLWNPDVAYLGWDMLKGYVYDEDPLGRGNLAWRARIPGRVVGGKTGTSNNARDLWFAGATRGMSAVVWIGRDDNQPMQMNGREPSSSVVNPPIWRQFVENALRGRPAGEPAAPEGLVQVRMDLLNGEANAIGTPAYFRIGHTPMPSTLPVGASILIGLEPGRDCLAGPEWPPEQLRWKAVPPGEVARYRCD